MKQPICLHPHRLAILLATALLVCTQFIRAAAVPEADPRRDATVTAIEKVLPSVVNVATETIVENSRPEDEMLRRFFGPYYQSLPPQAQRSVGSGVIIHEDGYILTNDHVVRSATHVWVKLADGRVFQAEPLVGTMLSDVALLRIVKTGNEKFTPIKLAGEDDLLLGETVIALGNPFGLGGSVSKGILSSKERQAPKTGEKLDISNWLQTDAAINPGNSGGPLVNLRGELIGINVAVLSEAQGIGFAVPVKRVSEAMSMLFTPEARGLWLGVRLRATTDPLRVLAVQPKSPAEIAGLRAGDKVVEVNGKLAVSIMDFSEQMVALGGKKDIPLVVQRTNDRLKLNVRMIALDDYFNADLVRSKLGVTLKELTQDVARSLKLGFYGGFLITDVEKNSPAATAGLKPNMVVRTIDGGAPPDVLRIATYLHDRTGEKVALEVLVRERTVFDTRINSALVELKVR